MIIAEKMFPEYGRDELFLSQTERIALNACFEAVRIEVAGKVKLNRSGSARSKVGRSVPQGDFHSGDGSGRGVRVVRMCFFRIGVGFLLWQHVCNRLLRCGIFLTEKVEDIVDIAEFRTYLDVYKRQVLYASGSRLIFGRLVLKNYMRNVCLGNDEPSEYSGAKQARKILEQAAALFASGTMNNEDKTTFRCV